jgi:hypothetical protein
MLDSESFLGIIAEHAALGLGVKISSMFRRKYPMIRSELIVRGVSSPALAFG